MMRALAIGIAGALAIDAATPLHAQRLSDGKAIEQNGSNYPAPSDTFPVLRAPSGSTIVGPVFSSRDQVTGGHGSGPDAYPMGRLDELPLINNTVPNEY